MRRRLRGLSETNINAYTRLSHVLSCCLTSSDTTTQNQIPLLFLVIVYRLTHPPHVLYTSSPLLCITQHSAHPMYISTISTYQCTMFMYCKMIEILVWVLNQPTWAVTLMFRRSRGPPLPSAELLFGGFLNSALYAGQMVSIPLFASLPHNILIIAPATHCVLHLWYSDRPR